MALLNVHTALAYLMLVLASLTCAQTTCTNNACLSVVKSNAKHASFTGCSQFFRVTVTPATSTITSTITKTTQARSTTTETSTTTDEITTTTKTNFITSTSTQTETTTSIVTSGKEDSTTTTTKETGDGMAKRAKSDTGTTTSQTTVPSYATSACMNTIRYSSACSCIGVTHRTTTFPAPSRTKKVTTKITTTRVITVNETTTEHRTTATETTESTLYEISTQTETTTRVVPPAPTLALDDPIKVVPDYNLDDDTFKIDLPFNVTFYGQSSSSVITSVNGFLSIDSPDIYGSYGSGPLPQYAGPSHLSDFSLPDTALAIYWTDLFIHTGDNQGIYYSISGTAPLRLAQFEWVTSRYNDRYAYYHFIMSLPEDSILGRVKYNYYELADNGAFGAVGAQSKPDDNFSQYEFAEDGTIYPGLTLVYRPLNNMFEIDDGIVP